MVQAYLKSDRPGQPVTCLVYRLPNGAIVRRKCLAVALTATEIAAAVIQFTTDCDNYFRYTPTGIVSRCDTVLL